MMTPQDFLKTIDPSHSGLISRSSQNSKCYLYLANLLDEPVSENSRSNYIVLAKIDLSIYLKKVLKQKNRLNFVAEQKE